MLLIGFQLLESTSRLNTEYNNVNEINLGPCKSKGTVDKSELEMGRREDYSILGGWEIQGHGTDGWVQFKMVKVTAMLFLILRQKLGGVRGREYKLSPHF